jgi:hypothetical protein
LADFSYGLGKVESAPKAVSLLHLELFLPPLKNHKGATHSWLENKDANGDSVEQTLVVGGFLTAASWNYKSASVDTNCFPRKKMFAKRLEGFE